MGEKLEAEVDFKTAQAVRNLKEVATTLEGTEKNLKATAVATEQVDKAMEDAADSTSKAKKEIKETGEEAKGTEKKLKDTAQAAKEAGKEFEDAGKKGKKGAKDTGDEVSLLSKATQSLTGEVRGLVMSFLSLQTAVAILREMEERIKAVVAARQKLAEFKLSQEETVAPLINNLGLVENAAGQQAALKVANEFRSRTGATLDQTVNILSQAQSSGIQVFDAGKGKVNESGMQMAATVGQYAARTRLDAETSGKLFNILKIAGVKDPQGAEKMLAQFDVAAKNSLVANPAQFVQAGIRAVAARMTQNVPFDQALAAYAAATVVNPDPNLAATITEQFSRVAGGDQPEQTLTLARIARQRGIITEPMLAPVRNEARTRLTGEKQDELDRLQRELSEAKDAEAITRKREDEDIANQQRAFSDPRDSANRNPRLRAERQQRLERAKEDLITQRRERQEAIGDKENRRKSIISDISEKAEDEALTSAYTSRVSRADQERFVLDLLNSLSPDDRRAMLRKIAPARIGDEVGAVVAPGPMEAYRAVMEGAKNPDVTAFRATNSAWAATNSLRQRAAAESRADVADTAAVGGGLMGAENFRLEAERSVTRDIASGKATFGSFTSATGKAHTAREMANLAPTKEGLIAIRQAIMARDQVQQMWDSMSPEDKTKHPEIKSFLESAGDLDVDTMGPNMDRFEIPHIVNQANLNVLPFTGGFTRNAELKASKFAERAAAIILGVQNEQNPGPSTQPTTQPAAPPATMPTTRPSLPGPQSSAIHQTIHIGNYFSTSGVDADLPGRLEGTA
jgi:hypothetical protein